MQIFTLRPYEGSEPFVYASFYHQDADAVYPILERIGRSGCRVWYNEENTADTQFSPIAQARLAQAESYLLFLSPDALHSEPIRKELSVAMDLGLQLCTVQLETVHFSRETDSRFLIVPSIDKNAYENEDQFYARLLGVNIPARCFDAHVRSSALRSPHEPPAEQKTAPAKSAPAKTTPAETAPAKTAPAKTAPAKTAPRSTSTTRRLAARRRKKRVTVAATVFICALGLALLLGILWQKKPGAPVPTEAVNATQDEEPASLEEESTTQAGPPAAESLPEALRSFTFTLAGESYSLPCRLAAFTYNGWEITSDVDPAEAKLGSGSNRAVTLEKDGMSVVVTFYNFSDSEKTLADCPIGGIDGKAPGGKNLTLSNGITCLSSPDEIRAAFGEPTKESVRGDYTILNYATDVFNVYVEFVCYKSGDNQSHSSVRLRNFAR